MQVVIEGSLLQSTEGLRLTVRALRVLDGVALFAASFDQRFEGVFEIQDAICRRIADSLALELTTAESARLTQHFTEDSVCLNALGCCAPDSPPCLEAPANPEGRTISERSLSDQDGRRRRD